jgi:hypothetical protein
VVGELTLHDEMLALPSDPHQTVCVYTAEPGSASAEALTLLAGWSASDAVTDTAPDTAPDATHGASLAFRAEDGVRPE